jgi:hypothetical protein
VRSRQSTGRSAAGDRAVRVVAAAALFLLVGCSGGNASPVAGGSSGAGASPSGASGSPGGSTPTSTGSPGGGPGASSGAGGTATSTPQPLPTEPDGCVPVGTGTVVNVGTPQNPLPAVLLGGGMRAVVLVNDGGQLLCAWLPFARVLSRAGLRVVLYDPPATDAGRALQDVTTWLRDRGNTDVAYVGAGSGAATATATAAATTPAPYAVVALSPATSAVRTPALYAAAATGDPAGAATARRLAAGNRLRLVPGSARGAALVARAGTLVTEITTYLHAG